MCKPAFCSSTKLLLTLLGLVIVTGCATTTVPTAGPDLGGPERQAQAYAAAGDTAAAVAIYADLYGRSVGTARAQYAIAAADLLIGTGSSAEAREWLERAETDAGPVQRPWVLVLSAELALLDGDATTALELLGGVTEPVERSLSVRTMAARGRALFQLGRIEEAVTLLVERDLWLDTDAEILANHELIWGGLQAQTFVRPVIATRDPVIDGWLALAPVAVATRSDPFSLAQGLDRWIVAYPRHPAAEFLLPALREQDRLSQIYPAQVALLLPLSSLPQPAAAVRDGFIAAYLQNPSGSEMRLRVYDTDELGSSEAYQQAQLDGAEFIVGPLLKPDVELIAANTSLIPTLALNTVDTDLLLPPNFYQFGLAPEDEAAEAVRHAIANGAETAVALFPNSEWGLRVFQSFQTEFEALGGRLLESRAYDSSTQDFSLAITTLLNLADSNQRHQRLAANLGLPIEFEPRRRQDVDMIFFAADPGAARLLAPQFRFHFAGDLPTYATSDIYEVAARGSDPDLNGVIFADIPWLLAPDASTDALKSSLLRYWPQRTTRWLRLYGLGFDAYRMLPLLYNPDASFVSIPGMSGELWIDTDGRVRRRLPIAQFRNGVPAMLVPEAPTEDTALDDQVLSSR
ncbi:MAG: penicillin-binding protein activator [Gammaproteobacteria bacterium]|nr:penicillin-binding protein activator [Gammaproteobacteria bacterium]